MEGTPLKYNSGKAERARRKRRIREWTIALGASALVACLLLGDAFVPGCVLSPADVLLSDELFGRRGYHEFEPANRLLTDVAFAFEPWLVEARRQLAHGHVPYLNPHAGLGVPLFGNYQSALLSPFNWPYLVLGTPETFAIGAFLKLVVAGTGAYFLARYLGLRPPYALAAGLWFELSGFVTLWLLYPLSSAAVWFPWTARTCLAAVRMPTSRRVAGFSLVTALILLAGHPETAAHVLAGALLFAALAERGRLLAPPGILRRFLALCTALLLGTSVAAPQIGAFLPYLKQSVALQERHHAADNRPLPQRLQESVFSVVTCLVPYAYGSYARGDVHVEKAFGLENFNETCGGYVSVAGVLLFLAGWAVRRKRAWIQPALWLATLGWLVGYKFPPLYDALQLLPGIGLIQHQRLLLWPCLFVPLVGAATLQFARETDMGARSRLLITLPLIGVAIACVATAFVIPRIERLIENRLESYLSGLSAQGRITPETAAARKSLLLERTVHRLPAHYVRSAAICAATAVAWLLTGVGSLRRTASSLLPLLILSDLYLFAAPQIPVIARDHWFPPLEPARVPGTASLAGLRVLVTGEAMPPNAATAYRIRDIRSYDGVEHAGLTRLLQAIDPDVTSPADSLHGHLIGKHTWRHRLLALLGTRTVAAAADSNFLPATGCWHRVGALGNLQLWELTCEPRAQLWFLPLGDSPPRSWSDVAARAQPLLSARYRESSPSHLEVEGTAPGGGIVLVPRLYVSGWTVAPASELSLSPVLETLVGRRDSPTGSFQGYAVFRAPVFWLARSCGLHSRDYRRVAGRATR